MAGQSAVGPGVIKEDFTSPRTASIISGAGTLHVTGTKYCLPVSQQQRDVHSHCIGIYDYCGQFLSSQLSSNSMFFV